MRDLTDAERKPMSRGRCPFCANDSFLQGPTGGMSQNIECAECGARYNVSFATGRGYAAHGTLFAAELLAGPTRLRPSPPDRWNLPARYHRVRARYYRWRLKRERERPPR